MSTTPEQIDLWRNAPSEHQRLQFRRKPRPLSDYLPFRA